MSEKKTKRIVSASDGKEIKGATKARVIKQAAPVGNATGLRIGAVALWVAAIVFEVLAILFLSEKIVWNFMSKTALMIIALVLDLICVVAGNLLWKKSNRIDPASEKNKVKFWLWNNLGVIVAALAFIPFVIIALTDKKADKKTKTIAVIVAAIALLVGVLFGLELDPTSQEDLQAAMYEIDGDVFWAPSGEVFHTSPDCRAFTQSEELITGSVEEAFAANRTRLCYFCAERDGIENVKTEEGVEDVVLEEAGTPVEDTAETLVDTNLPDAETTETADGE